MARLIEDKTDQELLDRVAELESRLGETEREMANTRLAFIIAIVGVVIIEGFTLINIW